MNLWLRMLRATDTQALFDCSIMPWIKKKVQESFSKQDEKYYNLTTNTCILWESRIGLCCVRLPAVQQNIRYVACVTWQQEFRDWSEITPWKKRAILAPCENYCLKIWLNMVLTRAVSENNSSEWIIYLAVVVVIRRPDVLLYQVWLHGDEQVTGCTVGRFHLPHEVLHTNIYACDRTKRWPFSTNHFHVN